MSIEWIGRKLRRGYSRQARERERLLNRPRLGLSEQTVRASIEPHTGEVSQIPDEWLRRVELKLAARKWIELYGEPPDAA